MTKNEDFLPLKSGVKYLTRGGATAITTFYGGERLNEIRGHVCLRKDSKDSIVSSRRWGADTGTTTSADGSIYDIVGFWKEIPEVEKIARFVCLEKGIDPDERVRGDNSGPLTEQEFVNKYPHGCVAAPLVYSQWERYREQAEIHLMFVRALDRLESEKESE